MTEFRHDLDRQNLASLKDFKFRSLPKFMAAIYAELNFHIHAPYEQKAELSLRFAAEFFRRLRDFHGVPLGELARRFGLAPDRLRAFEAGELAQCRQLPRLYVGFFRAQGEFEAFYQRLQQFKRSQPMDDRAGLAKIALRRFGVKFPGPHRPEPSEQAGEVIPLKRR